MRMNWMLLAMLAICSGLAIAAPPAPAGAEREHLIAPGFPHSLHIFDAATLAHTSEIVLPGDASPTTATLAPDRRTLFVVTSRSGSVVGVDLPSGKTVFRAVFSQGNERVTSFPAVALSPDGAWLYVCQSPVRLLPGEYEALPPRFAVYRVADGLQARPVRTFPAPGKIFLLLPSPDADAFLALGDSLYKFDARSGKPVAETPVRQVARPGYAAIDYFPYWAQGSSLARAFTVPYYTARIGADGSTTPAFGFLRVDLDEETVTTDEILDGDPEITHAWRDPVDPSIAYSVGIRLTRLDMKTRRKTAQVPLDRAYKQAVSSTDGSTIYVGGGLDYILAFDARTLERKGILRLPRGADQANGFLYVARW